MHFIKSIQEPAVSDQELAAGYRKSGDMNLLATLFQRYMDLLYGVCLKYLKEPETARDAVMQVFEELVLKLRKHEVDNVKSWLYTLAKNHCLMQLRTPRNLATTELKTELMQSEEEVHLKEVLEKEEHFHQLEHCMKTLSQEQQMAVRLFYLEQKCYKEIAHQTGIDHNKVRSHIQNGRRNLKICMEKKQATSRIGQL